MTSYINGTVEVCHQPFDGSGNFNRLMNWVADATAGTKIKSDRHDTEDNNFASGLSNVICKDGQTAVTADIPLNGKKLVNVGAPVNPTDAATKGYADAIRAFSTAISLTGASPQSRIAFPVADIGFGAREAGAPAGTLSRWVWNDKPDLSGTDVMTLTDTGILNAPTMAVGTTDGSSVGNGITFRKRGSGFSEGIYFSDGAGGLRDGIFSDASDQLVFRVGDNATTDITFSTSGDITALGSVVAAGNFVSSTASVILAATGAGQVVLRPNGVGSATGQAVLSSAGNLSAPGNIAATGSLTAAGSNIVIGPGGSGRIMQFQSSWYLDWNSSDGTLMWHSPSGNDFFSGAGNFTIRGATAVKSAGTTWANPSDERIKTVTGDYATGLSEILQITPRRFTYKGNDTGAALGDDGTLDEEGNRIVSDDEALHTVPYKQSPHYQMAVDSTEITGFVAQEIEGVMPDLVTQGSGYIDGEPVDDFRVVDTSNLTYALVNAVKELSAKLDAANARIEALEAIVIP